MLAYACNADRARTLTGGEVEELLCRAEHAHLIDGWRSRGEAYEIFVTVGSFRLEPNAAGVFVSTLFEATEKRLAVR